jgi:hypothetical protein
VGVTQITNRSIGKGAIAPFPLLVLALVAALVLTVRIEEWRLAAQRRRAAVGMLAESNRSAERDTTRDVALQNARVARLLGDSLRLVEKEVLQVAQKRDALDAALGRERAARYAAIVVVDSVERLIAAANAAIPAPGFAASREVRAARFDLRQEPYTIIANVAMPPPPDSATLQVKISVDPIAIVARVTCADIGSGAREASVSVETPAWVRVRLGTVSQTPDVCARSPARESFLRWPRLATRRLVLGVGRAWGVDRQGRWAVFIGTGIAL